MFEFFYIGLIALLGAISPGPDFVVVVKYALTHDRNMAMMAAIGVGVGILFHASYCVLGLAIIISNSILAFNIIKYLGASYLIYLGIKSLLASKTIKGTEGTSNAPSKKQVTPWQAFSNGLLTNVLNPKCTLFMLSIFTLVVKPHTPRLIQSLFGIEIAVITCTWFIFLSYGFTHPFVRAKINKVQQLVGKIIGVVLLSLGIMVMMESR